MATDVQTRRRLPSLLAVIVIVFSILACNTEERRSALPVPHDTYIIDTKSILVLMVQGKEDIFVPAISSDAEETPSEFPVSWRQSDYLKIADALHDEVWDVSLENWELNSMIFRSSCRDISNGLQDARFVFYNIMMAEEGKERIVHNIVIDPERSIVDVWALKYSPVVINWKTVDLASINVTADEALHIAESNGGKEKRNSVDNNCYVSVSFVPDSAGFDGWRVSYYQNPGVLLELNIDPISGGIQ